MAVRLAHCLNQVKKLEKQNRELTRELAATKKELAEVSKEKHLLSRKVQKDQD